MRAGQHATLAVHPADPPVAGGRPLRAPDGAGMPAAARCHSADVLSGGALRTAMRAPSGAGAQSGRQNVCQGQTEGVTHPRRSSTPGLGSPWEDASCGVGPCSGGEAGRGGAQGGKATDGPAGLCADQEALDLGVERDREAQRLRQRPAAHPTEAYREPWRPRARGSDSLHAPRPPAQPHAAAAGLGQGTEACSNGGSGGGTRQRKEPPGALEVPEYGTGLEFSNTNGSGRGHPGDPPGPPPAPDVGAAGAGAGLHWDPEPARWELRSRSAPPGASAACSPPNSRKVRWWASTCACGLEWQIGRSC